MAAGIFAVPPYFPARDRNGDLVGGAIMAVYVNRTTTLATIYSDEGLTNPLDNPIIANSSGRFQSAWAEAGDSDTPVLYTVAFKGPGGESIGNPDTFYDYQPGLSYDTASVALVQGAVEQAESAALDSETAATASEAALEEILAVAAAAPEIPSIVNKANITGDNAQAVAFRDNLNLPEIQLFAKDFGVVSDTVNAAAVVQTAVNDAASIPGVGVTVQAVVRLPKSWRLDTTVTIPSGVIIDLDGGVCDTRSASQTPFVLQGGYGSNFNTAANVTRGDTALSTTVANGFAGGDLLQIMSQRDCLSDDADPDWRLGDDNQALYFGEFLAVESVQSTTAFTIASGLIFPDYLITNSGETDPNARPRTTIRKFNPVRNAGIRNGRILRGAYGSAIYAHACHNVKFDSLTFEMYDHEGKAIWISESIDTEGQNCTALHDLTLEIDQSNHGKYNAFVWSSSTRCGFVRCVAVGGGQSFNPTFNTGSIPHIDCYARECKTPDNKWNGVVTHPGGYGFSLTDCIIDSANTAIQSRTRGALIRGNICRGRGPNALVGIALAGNAAKDSIITDNPVIEGFDIGIDLFDSIANGAPLTPRIIVTNNIIRDCGEGFRKYSTSNSLTDQASGLVVAFNTMSLIKRQFVNIGGYTNYADIHSNMLIGPLSDPEASAIELAANTVGCKVVLNTIVGPGLGTAGVRYSAITDTVTFPPASWPDGPLHEIWNTVLGPKSRDVTDSLTSPQRSPNMGQRMQLGARDQVAQAALARTMPGLELMGGLNQSATNKYFAALKWMATDSDLTTENPKFVAAIVAAATQTYSGDTTGGASLDFFATENTPGTTNIPDPVGRMINSAGLGAVLTTGAFLLPDGITAPGTIVSGYASLYIDTADGDLKVRFADGTVKTVVTDT